MHWFSRKKPACLTFGKWAPIGIFFNARAIPGLELDQIPAVICEQPDKSLYEKLSEAGYKVSPEINPAAASAGGAIVVAGRSKTRNLRNLARAWSSLAESGKLLVVGTKTDGIGSLKKRIAKSGPIEQSVAKFHCTVFSAIKQDIQVEIPPEPEKVGRYRTAPGVFSEDGPDAGSVILARCFDDRIKGRVADFGAGWGYLSSELARVSANVETIDLYEADFVSLKMAKANLEGNDRITVSFHWVDLIHDPPLKKFDWIIMNPPFHKGRQADPELGMAFIRVASSSLSSRGKLLMVANRKLPYEGVLSAEFRRFEVLDEHSGFKVIEAER